MAKVEEESGLAIGETGLLFRCTSEGIDRVWQSRVGFSVEKRRWCWHSPSSSCTSAHGVVAVALAVVVAVVIVMVFVLAVVLTVVLAVVVVVIVILGTDAAATIVVHAAATTTTPADFVIRPPSLLSTARGRPYP